jgi:hypothetical protein
MKRATIRRGISLKQLVLELLKYASINPIINVKNISDFLKMPARRFYDILNVMEGLNYAKRISKGNYSIIFKKPKDL